MLELFSRLDFWFCIWIWIWTFWPSWIGRKMQIRITCWLYVIPFQDSGIKNKNGRQNTRYTLTKKKLIGISPLHNNVFLFFKACHTETVRKHWNFYIASGNRWFNLNSQIHIIFCTHSQTKLDGICDLILLL